MLAEASQMQLRFAHDDLRHDRPIVLAAVAQARAAKIGVSRVSIPQLTFVSV